MKVTSSLLKQSLRNKIITLPITWCIGYLKINIESYKIYISHQIANDFITDGKERDKTLQWDPAERCHDTQYVMIRRRDPGHAPHCPEHQGWGLFTQTLPSCSRDYSLHPLTRHPSTPLHYCQQPLALVPADPLAILPADFSNPASWSFGIPVSSL